MQISITAGIPENEIQRKHSENTKNLEMTEEWQDTDLGVLGLRSHENTETLLGNTSAWIRQNHGMNNTVNEQWQADEENKKKYKNINKNKTEKCQTVTTNAPIYR